MEVKWIKLSTDLFNNRKIRQIERMDDGDAIIVIWLKLLILAGEINDGGEIYFTKEVPFTEESLAVQFDRPRELIALALRTFQAYGMIEIDDDALSIRNWEKYQNIEGMEKIREQNRIRQQRKRGMDKVKIDGKLICAYCGETGDSVDHIIPRAKGGSDDAENLVCSCKHCNMQKNNRDLDVFLNDRLRMGEPVVVGSIIENPKLNKYVYFDDITKRFKKRESRVTNATDKKRIDKNREDIIHTSPADLLNALSKKWQTNIDGDEANKEIRQ